MGAVAEGDNSIGLHRVTQQRRHKSMPAPIRRHWARRHSQLPLGRAAHTRPLCTGICHVCARRICAPSSSTACTRSSPRRVSSVACYGTLCVSRSRQSGMMPARTQNATDGSFFFVALPRARRSARATAEGSWTQLLRESVAAAQPAQPVRDAVRAPESPQVGSESDIRRRADRASALAHLGEMSAAAKALTAPP